MIKRLLKASGDLLLTTAIFSAGAYGYLYYTATQNQKRYLKSIQSQTLKDASRLTNDSFGISWGFQSDDTIMSRIDSGDLLLIKFQCFECLTPSNMVNCLIKTAHFIEEQYHTAGWAFRDQTGLYVVYNEYGETKIKKYCELVSLPYLRQLTLQKNEEKKGKRHQLLKKQFENESAVIKESGMCFINRINKLLGHNETLNNVNELMTGEQKINIRTETNKTLQSL